VPDRKLAAEMTLQKESAAPEKPERRRLTSMPIRKSAAMVLLGDLASGQNAGDAAEDAAFRFRAVAGDLAADHRARHAANHGAAIGCFLAFALAFDFRFGRARPRFGLGGALFGVADSRR
jgi:hypothetical protein